MSQQSTKLNQIPIAEGQLIIDHEQYTDLHEQDQYIFGFRKLRIWLPHHQRWVSLTNQDADKFVVCANTPSEAKQTFYLKWKNFTQRAFKLNYIEIKSTN